MPIYEFRCPKCLERVETILPIENRGDAIYHSCGTPMVRLMTVPQPPIIKIYNMDKITNTLNEEHKYSQKSGDLSRSARSTAALAKGLNYTRPVEDKVFTGF